LPSPETRSLLRGYFEGFAWGIIHGDMGWELVFDNFSANDFVVVRDFLIDQ
jgi:hypothetical protein